MEQGMNGSTLAFDDKIMKEREGKDAWLKATPGLNDVVECITTHREYTR